MGLFSLTAAKDCLFISFILCLMFEVIQFLIVVIALNLTYLFRLKHFEHVRHNQVKSVVVVAKFQDIRKVLSLIFGLFPCTTNSMPLNSNYKLRFNFQITKMT